MGLRTLSMIALAAQVALLGSACQNRIGGRLAPAGGQAPPAGGDGDTTSPPEMDPPADQGRPPFAPAPAALHRLTRVEYQNTIHALFGDAIRVTADLEVDTPLYGFTTVGASSLTVASHTAE